MEDAAEKSLRRLVDELRSDSNCNGALKALALQNLAQMLSDSRPREDQDAASQEAVSLLEEAAKVC